MKRRCTAHLSDGSGRRCKLAPVKGASVCHKHGGGAPQVKRTARQRLDALVDPALSNLERALVKAADRGAELSTPALRAAAMCLDRAGYPAGVQVQVEDHRESRAWAQYATAEERRQLLAIMERCQRRMEGQERAAGNGSEPAATTPPAPKATPEVLEL